jgi:nucleoside-diphosphate-sugar epimerase
MMGAVTSAQHVIFGAGAIGTTLAEALHRRGESGIRLVSRSGRAAGDGIESVAGDAADPAFAKQVAAGASVVYQVLNPPYHRWAEEFPALQESVLGAAEAAGARLVSMENVYLYGRPSERPFVETDPSRANTRKGRLRGEMSARLLEAHRAGRVAVAIGRASDYYGPRGGAQSLLGDRAITAIQRGRAVSSLGDPHQAHTYTYIPDIANGLAILGTDDRALGRVWHLPNDERPKSTADLLSLLADALGRPLRAVRRIPPLLLKSAGLVNPTLRELVEMEYEFEAPFLVSSEQFRTTFGVSATPYEAGLAETARSTHPDSPPKA